MKKSILLTALLVALAVTAAGCGSKKESEESATPTEAIAEIETIRTMLGDAVAKYRSGDAEQAEKTVGDAYLEHFEHVEDPLGDRNHDLMEELEERISTEIRDEMKDGAPVTKIESLVRETNRELDEAVTELKK